jgi:(Z)-2-((N-methylformamido)methylene)-5-hydroxybutyrolactone dehydrogenase
VSTTALPTTYPMFIGGDFVAATSGETFATINPGTGREWARAPQAGPEDVDRAVAAARAALNGDWGSTSGWERARLLRRLADLVARDAEELARLETSDNGKLLRETLGVVAQIPDYLIYFAGLVDTLGGETIPTSNKGYLVYTEREPVGVIAALVPWNNPLMLLAWKIGPALAAGCTVVVKTSEASPISSIAFARLIEEAGFPAGAVNIISGEGAVAGRALVRHPGVDKVSFTGSTAVGMSVMADAASHLAEVALELGGKSPHIVFADADLEAAAFGVVGGIFASSGQMCTAGSRLFVERSVAGEFVERLRSQAAAIRIGDPSDLASEMGPLATEAQLGRVSDLVASAHEQGATLVHGGTRVDQDGFFFEPTIFTDVTPDMRVFVEEAFGPLLVVVPFDSEEEAVELANATEYGLAGGVWTSHVQRAHRVARAIQAGTVWINCYRNVAANVPFGGMGQSGFSRENGAEVARSFTRTRAVWVELDGQTRDPFKMA